MTDPKQFNLSTKLQNCTSYVLSACSSSFRSKLEQSTHNVHNQKEPRLLLQRGAIRSMSDGPVIRRRLPLTSGVSLGPRVTIAFEVKHVNEVGRHPNAGRCQAGKAPRAMRVARMQPIAERTAYIYTVTRHTSTSVDRNPVTYPHSTVACITPDKVTSALHQVVRSLERWDRYEV